MLSPAESSTPVQDVKAPAASGAAQCNKSQILMLQLLTSQLSDLSQHHILPTGVANMELAPLLSVE